jgi:signal transduction histidine kinase
MRRHTPLSLATRLTIAYSLLFAVVGAAMLALVYLGVRAELAGEFPDEVREPMPSTSTTEEWSSEDIVTSVQDEVRAAALRSILTQSTFGYIVMSVVALALGAAVVRRTLRPLSEIATVAERISHEELGHRVGLSGHPVEISRLALSFDRMVARLQRAFEGQGLFVANASHELRTPMTVIRTVAEVTRAKHPRQDRDVDAAFDAIIDAATRGQDLLNGLLRLAAIGSSISDEVTPVRLDRLADETLGRLDGSNIIERRELSPASALGDETLLRVMVSNLVENAARHNLAEGGWVEVSTGANDREVWLQVANPGSHIDPQIVATLSEPFSRLDRRVPGHGLGLAMASTIALAHSGRLSLTPRPSGGLVARVVLPPAEP